MGAWLQILLIVGHSTLFYLIFDTHASPESVFIWKSNWNCGKNLSPISLCDLVYITLGRISFELIKTIPEIVYTCTVYVFEYDNFHDVALMCRIKKKFAYTCKRFFFQVFDIIWKMYFITVCSHMFYIYFVVHFFSLIKKSRKRVDNWLDRC